MPKIKSMSIRNFKGIEDVTIDFSNRINSSVVTLIGLNESGKTTILEAISHFATKDATVSSMFRDENSNEYINSVIPIHKKANFTGSIKISAVVELDSNDKKCIENIVKKYKHKLDPKSNFENMTIYKEFLFKDGEYVSPTYASIWSGLDLKLAKGRSTKFKRFVRPTSEQKTEGMPDIWLECIDDIGSRVANVVYFPTFLVDIPERIYLAKHSGESQKNRYYREMLQNVLDSLNENLSIDDHVVDRIEKYKTQTGIQNWISSLLGDPLKGRIDPVFSKLSIAVTREVLGSWSKVFNRPVAAKRIDINWFVDPQNDIPYATITVSDGESPYALHERSLGFRWFFSFLLFTRFGGARKRPNLFLFDEPAANLHARAQAELLGSFDKLLSAGDLIMYSTHSHHMIRPEWLSGAYIVENEAIDYEGDNAGADFSIRPTKIHATSYRKFVGENGSRISYFQPVLERLQYIEPALVANGPEVLLEGPSDFYLFKYILNKKHKSYKWSLIPGGGAGSLDSMIAIALSRGNKFLVLLDDDGEGRKESKRYREKWCLTDQEVFTLGDLNTNLVGKKLESLISADTIENIKIRYGNARKSSIGYYMAEAAATMNPSLLSSQTEEVVSGILKELNTRLKK